MKKHFISIFDSSHLKWTISLFTIAVLFIIVSSLGGINDNLPVIAMLLIGIIILFFAVFHPSFCPINNVKMKIFIILFGLSFTLIVNAQDDEMIKVGNIYVDKYEAPNIAGQQPLVMYSYQEAQSWCTARGERLLFDDEWVTVAAGPSLLPYVYGLTYDPQICKDDKTYISPNEILLNNWPIGESNTMITSFTDLINGASAVSPEAEASANEVVRLYQADNSGSNLNCFSYYNIFDLNGNVGEWTTRRDGGSTDFHGSIKGGYWFQPRTIQSSVTAYGDAFRAYYLGFRCAKDEIPTLSKSIESNEHYVVYPNPSTNYLVIRSSKIKTLQILNFEGQILNTINYPEDNKLIDIRYLHSGMYFLRIIMDKEISVTKFIKE